MTAMRFPARFDFEASAVDEALVRKLHTTQFTVARGMLFGPQLDGRPPWDQLRELAREGADLILRYSLQRQEGST